MARFVGAAPGGATRKLLSRAVLFGCALLLAHEVSAIGLQDYVRDVLRADPRVREQISVYRQAVQDHEIALAGWRPSLDLQASTGRFSQQKPADANFDSSELDLTLTQNLFNGFDTTNQIKQAKARVKSAIYQLYDTADNSALAAIRAYISALTERKLVELAEQNANSHERIFFQISERNAAGIGRRSDIEQTDGRLASAKASLISQQNNLQDALSQVHRALGRYLRPEDLEDPAYPPRPSGKIEALIAAALRDHPALESARQNIEAARFDKQRQKRTNLPRIDLQLQHRNSDNAGGVTGSREHQSVLLNLQYNLYRGGADRAEQRKKISTLHEVSAFRARVRRQVIEALRLSWNADQALQEQLPYFAQYVEKADQTLALYHEEFFLQKRDLIDVLNAESELNTAQRRQTQAYYDSLTARYRVYEGMGQLFESLGITLKIDDDQLQIADLQIASTDPESIDLNLDEDGFIGDLDQCDNSRGKTSNYFGCDTGLRARFGYRSANHPPQAEDDSFSTAMNTALTIAPVDLLANDSDADKDILSIEGSGNPAHGKVIEDADGYLIYAPDKDYTGIDSFTYFVGDRRGGRSTGTVTVQVGPAPGTAASILFGYKKTGLDPVAISVIDAYARKLQANPAATLVIRAYTDNIGPQPYNIELSTRRAAMIKALLVDKGIEAGRIQAIGMGENNPVATNSTEQGRARNRRAEFELQTQ